jgi:sugar phosphate isomerase/epimerase
MVPGLSSYTFTWAVGVPGSIPENPMTAERLIEIAAANEIHIVQIADNLPLENLGNDDLVRIREFAGSKGVKLEMGGRGLTPEHTFRCLQTAEKIGSSILRMVIDAKDFEPDIKETVSIIRELLPEFSSRKIRLAIENHDRLKARDFEKIIQSVGSDWTGICLDSVNSMGAGEGFGTVAEILIPYTINLHVKDFTIKRVSHKMGIIIEGAPAGKGMLDIPDLVEKIDKFKKCSSAILELWTPPEQELDKTLQKEEEWALESIKYLRSIMQISVS